MNALERLYRLLLLAFPRRYRAERGDEMLTTLMESAGPEQRLPRPGEVVDLVDHGLQARTGLSARSPLGSVLGMAAPYALGVAAGIASVCLVFGELKVPGLWRAGWQPNQFTGMRFETNAMPVYGCVLLAFVALLVGWAGVARVLAALGCLAVYVSLTTGGLRGNGHPPVDLLALIALCLLPTVVAPVMARSRVAVGAVALATVVLGVVLVPPLPEGRPDSRYAFYADVPMRVINSRPYFVAAAVLVVLFLLVLAFRRRDWHLAAIAGLLVPPFLPLLTDGAWRSQYSYHWELAIAVAEGALLLVLAVLSRLGELVEVSVRRR